MQNKNAGDYLEAIGRILTEKTEYDFTVEENEYGADLVSELPSPFSEEGRSGCAIQLKRINDDFFLFALRITLLSGLPEELYDDITAVSEMINDHIAAGTFKLERESGVLYFSHGIIIDSAAQKSEAALNIFTALSVMAATAENTAELYSELISGEKSAEAIIGEICET